MSDDERVVMVASADCPRCDWMGEWDETEYDDPLQEMSWRVARHESHCKVNRVPMGIDFQKRTVDEETNVEPRTQEAVYASDQSIPWEEWGDRA